MLKVICGCFGYNLLKIGRNKIYGKLIKQPENGRGKTLNF